MTWENKIAQERLVTEMENAAKAYARAAETARKAFADGDKRDLNAAVAALVIAGNNKRHLDRVQTDLQEQLQDKLIGR